MDSNSSQSGSKSTVKHEPANESLASSTTSTPSQNVKPLQSDLTKSTASHPSEQSGPTTRRRSSRLETEPSLASKSVGSTQHTTPSKALSTGSLFKTPPPVKPSSSSTFKPLHQKSSDSISISKSLQSLNSKSGLLSKTSKSPTSSTLSSQATRTGQSPKKKPAVKIASFAKSSPTTSSASPSKDDEENESDDEEELLVYMQFDAQLDSDLLRPDTAFKIIGVDTDKPVLQLGNQVYEGDWRDMIGTALFFEEDRNIIPGDPVFTKNPAHMLKYHSKTRKTLHMSRVFIKPKDGAPTDEVTKEALTTTTAADAMSGPTSPTTQVAVLQLK